MRSALPRHATRILVSITISNPHFMKDVEKVAHNAVMPEDSSALQAFSLYFRGASSLLCLCIYEFSRESPGCGLKFPEIR